MKFVVFYELATDGLAKVPANYLAHTERLKEFNQAGTLLMAGPYGSPPRGALSIFTTRDAAEAFVAEDPFVLNGTVARYEIHEWLEGLAP